MKREIQVLILAVCLVGGTTSMIEAETKDGTTATSLKNGITSTVIDSAESSAKSGSDAAIKGATDSLGGVAGSDAAQFGGSLADQAAKEKIGTTADSARARFGGMADTDISDEAESQEDMVQDDTVPEDLEAE